MILQSNIRSICSPAVIYLITAAGVVSVLWIWASFYWIGGYWTMLGSEYSLSLGYGTVSLHVGHGVVYPRSATIAAPLLLDDWKPSIFGRLFPPPEYVGLENYWLRIRVPLWLLLFGLMTTIWIIVKTRSIRLRSMLAAMDKAEKARERQSL